MKKILAIAISLVMVFAVAASAFAIFGFKASTTPVLVDDFEVDVQLYDVGSTGAANSMIPGEYPVHAPTSGVRDGETYAFGVELFIPAYAGLTNTGKALLWDTTGPAYNATTTLTIGFDNLIVKPAAGVAGGAVGGSGAAAVNKTAIPAAADWDAAATWYSINAANDVAELTLADLSLFEDGTNTAVPVPEPNTPVLGSATYFITAECVIDELADATVSAVFGAPDPDVGLVAGATTCVIGNWGISKNAEPATVYTMEEWNFTANPAARTQAQVDFAVGTPDAADNQAIISTYVSLDQGTTPYLVSQNPTTGDLQFHDGVTALPVDRVSDAALYDGLLGALNRAMAAMGFTWTPGGVLYDEGFEALAARGLQFSDSATFYAYTAALTVAGAATVPDTGDTTVVGIVMMAVAILATAAIVIRKVRA